MTIFHKYSIIIIIFVIFHFKAIHCFRILRTKKLNILKNNDNNKLLQLSDSAKSLIGFDISEDLKVKTDSLVDNVSNSEFDYIVIGSGIGGLSCAALLRFYGYKVLVLESHYTVGGVAHSFERKGFKFDSGPSLWNGMSTKPFNPLREIMEIVGKGGAVKYAHYGGWVMHVPEGSFKFTVGEGNFESVLKKFGGPNVLQEWNQLLKILEPVQKLSTAIPPLILRNDLGLILTLFPHLGNLLSGALVASKVEGPFKSISEKVVKDKFLENWLEFLSFALSGLPADGTIAAAVAYTMRDLHQDRASLDYPLGGSDAVVKALVDSITEENNNNVDGEKSPIGTVLLNSHVSKIIVENGVAVGVELRRKGKIIKAKRAVISNASIWDTTQLLPEGSITTEERKEKMDTPMTNSFVHLYLGIKADGLPKDLESHYSVINKWSPIDAPQNHVIISIPSVLDPSLAPEGCHVIHAYAAANEPYDLWEKSDLKEYENLKTERCRFLWEAIERSIPDVRERVVVELSGSPFTHARFNRRYKGTYGPALRAGKAKFPYPKTNIKNLLMCGDSIFPGIGVPAVAASGANAASSTVSVLKHLKMLDKLYNINNSNNIS